MSYYYFFKYRFCVEKIIKINFKCNVFYASEETLNKIRQ